MCQKKKTACENNLIDTVVDALEYSCSNIKIVKSQTFFYSTFGPTVHRSNEQSRLEFIEFRELLDLETTFVRITAYTYARGRISKCLYLR